MLLVSFNVLAERYNVSGYGWDDYRKIRVCKIISDINPDVLCLQEVELDKIDTIVEDIGINNYTYYSHVISKKRTNNIGNLTAWKSKYTMLECNFTSSAIIVKLGEFIIANVHLKAGLNTGLDIRQKQMKSILTYSPNMIVGDFNDELNEYFNEKSSNNFNEKSSNNYKLADTRITTYVSNAHTKKFWSFDHLLYSTTIDTKNIIVETIHSDLTEPIPSDIHPSDHIPLIYNIIICG